jgi:hypothetical protein
VCSVEQARNYSLCERTVTPPPPRGPMSGSIATSARSRISCNRRCPAGGSRLKYCAPPAPSDSEVKAAAAGSRHRGGLPGGRRNPPGIRRADGSAGIGRSPRPLALHRGEVVRLAHRRRPSSSHDRQPRAPGPTRWRYDQAAAHPATSPGVASAIDASSHQRRSTRSTIQCHQGHHGNGDTAAETEVTSGSILS